MVGAIKRRNVDESRAAGEGKRKFAFRAVRKNSVRAHSPFVKASGVIITSSIEFLPHSQTLASTLFVMETKKK